MKRSLPRLALLLFAGLPAAGAAPLWNIDFADMETGAPPPVLNPPTAGAVNTRPTVVANNVVSETNFIHVVEDFTANGKTLTGPSVLFRKSVSSSQEMTLVGASADYTPWSDYELSFRLLVNATDNSGQPFNLRLTTTDANTSVAFLTFGMDGSLVFSSTLNSSSSLVIEDAWNLQEINTVTVQVHADTTTAFAFINGREVGRLTLDLANSETAPLGIGRIRFRNNTTSQLYAGGFAIADIIGTPHLSPIPEPGSVALGAAGLALLLARRWPRKASPLAERA